MWIGNPPIGLRDYKSRRAGTHNGFGLCIREGLRRTKHQFITIRSKKLQV